MGKISHSTPMGFAEELREYLWAQIEPLGADASGRWLETNTSGVRKKDYWAKIVSGAQAMTTNDVQVIAEALFDQTPYDFIRAVKVWNSPGATIHRPDFARELVDDERAVASPITDEDPDSGYDGA